MSDYFSPQPKPPPKQKGQKKNKTTRPPVIDLKGPLDKVAVVEALKAELEPKRDVKAQNEMNRNFGKNVERAVAKITGGGRTPGSGAIKNSVLGLEGDVQVFYKDSRELLTLIECKGSSTITPAGDKTFTLKKSVLDQAKKEAEGLRAVAAVWVHWKSANYETEDYVILPSQAFVQLLDLARMEREEVSHKGDVNE